jgi:hypothetical protein
MTELMQVTRVLLKARTIDSWLPWLAERGTASHFPTLRPRVSCSAPVCCFMDPQLWIRAQNQLQLLYTCDVDTTNNTFFSNLACASLTGATVSVKLCSQCTSSLFLDEATVCARCFSCFLTWKSQRHLRVFDSPEPRARLPLVSSWR